MDSSWILLAGFVAAFSELFPELGLSYFLPRSKDAGYYDKTVLLRVLNGILVWGIFQAALSERDKLLSIISFMFIMLSFSNRMWAADHDQPISMVFYVIGFSTIFYILTNGLVDKISVNLLVLSMILGGGFMISVGRYGSLWVDLVGRVIFSVGVMLFADQLKPMYL